MPTQKTSYVFVTLLMALSLVLTFIGCGDSAKFGYVSGKVLIDEQPAPEGFIVRFQPLDKDGSPSSSFTDKNGKYELWFSKTVKGVQLGTATIAVTQQTSDMNPKPVPEYLPAFNGKKLTFDVQKGSQTYDINIDSSLKLEKKKKKKR